MTFTQIDINGGQIHDEVLGRVEVR